MWTQRNVFPSNSRIQENSVKSMGNRFRIRQNYSTSNSALEFIASRWTDDHEDRWL